MAYGVFCVKGDLTIIKMSSLSFSSSLARIQSNESFWSSKTNVATPCLNQYILQ